MYRNINDNEVAKNDTIAPQITNVWGVNNFLPKMQEEEDDRTIAMYKSGFQDQFQKVPSNR